MVIVCLLCSYLVVVSRACLWLSFVCCVAMLVVVSRACMWLSFV